MNFELLTALAGNHKESIFVLDTLGNIRYHNDAAIQLYGKKSVTLTGKSFYKVFGEHLESKISPLFNQIKGNKGFRLTAGIRIEQTFITSTIQVFRFLDGKESLLLLKIHNLSSEIRDNASQLYKLLAENAYDVNLMFTKNELIYISPSVHDFLGYFDKEICSLEDWYDTFHAQDLLRYKDIMQRDDQMREPFSFITYRQKHKKGHYLWFETKIRRDFRDDGTFVSILTSMDVTQRRRAELELARQKEFIEELFDTDPNLIFVRDGNGKMIYCNKAVAELAGMSREEFLESQSNAFPFRGKLENEYSEMENKVINQGHEILIEETIEDSNGIINHFQTLKKPLRTRDGDINLLNISTNINQIKYYQREVQKAMAAKSEFFASMSHEIRTPMNAVIGMTELLMNRRPREDQYKLLKTLHFSANALLSLINNLLDIQKIEAGKLELEEINFNLTEILDNLVLSHKPIAVEKGLTFRVEKDNDIPDIINGDSIKLGQILNNLVSNAIKFTDDGEVNVRIQRENKEDDQIILIFEIQDTGIGIDAGQKEEIFKPFNQANNSIARKYGGTGLGLSIVKNLIELYGGEISLHSKPGEGTRFIVTLPFHKADKSKPVSKALGSGGQKVKWKLNLKLLYVEDVPTNQMLLEEILADWGIKADMASNGYEALEKIKNRQYDLILMDIQMPELDGKETTIRIRATEDEYYQKVPIIALTASTAPSMKDELTRIGFNDMITKPIDTSLLKEKIIEYTKIDKSETVFTDVAPVSSEEEYAELTVNFSATDKIFTNNTPKYKEFLNKTIEEFDLNKADILEALKKADVDTFRRINHRMKSIVSTLSIMQLSDKLENLKNSLEDKSLNTDKESIELGYLLDSVRDALINKVSLLKWH